MRACALLFLLAAGVVGEDPPSPSAFRFPIDRRVKRNIDLDEIQRGVLATGDPRDVIASIRKPEFAAAGKAPWVANESRVLGLVVNGDARAYPLYILQVHELVNDVVGGVPVAPNY